METSHADDPGEIEFQAGCEPAPPAPEPGIYFFVRFLESLQADYESLAILESGDERLLERQAERTYHPEEDSEWEGFTEVVSLQRLLCLISGMTPRGCHEWVSGADADDFGGSRPSPSPLWFASLLSPAALEGKRHAG